MMTYEADTPVESTTHQVDLVKTLSGLYRYVKKKLNLDNSVKNKSKL